MPSAFGKRDDLSPGLQMGIHGNDLILFHTDTERETVRIERIVHGSRQIQDLF